MAHFGPLVAEIGSVVWDIPANFNGFRVLAALLRGSQAVSISQTVRVEQRVPPMFGRVTIRLGIGPHSSCYYYVRTTVCCISLDVIGVILNGSPVALALLL